MKTGMIDITVEEFIEQTIDCNWDYLAQCRCGGIKCINLDEFMHADGNAKYTKEYVEYCIKMMHEQR